MPLLRQDAHQGPNHRLRPLYGETRERSPTGLLFGSMQINNGARLV
jgi:hypothetical protein